jgi:hypothetical protein
MKKILDDFDFRNNNIISLNGNYITDYKPFFDYIENYCLENGASTKWVEDMLIVYVKDYTKLDYKKCDLSEYYVQFLFSIFDEDSTEGEEEYSSVYFGDNVPDINSFVQLDEALDAIINKSLNPLFFKNENEEESPTIKTPVFSQEDFQNELKLLRISEAEFQNLLKIYNSL